MKSQHDDGAVEVRFHLIFNIVGADQYAAEIAGKSGPLTAPHADGRGTAQSSHV
jgi:hypothetical protein